MSTPPIIDSAERLILSDAPGARKSPEAFLAEFDLTRVPTQPGCYLMHDTRDRVLYVGKANNLRTRIRQYVNEQDARYSVKFLMRRVAHIDFLVTTNGKEALLLENSLIKQYKPRYNVHLKDDKTYVSVRLNLRHDFPRLTVTRKLLKDGSRYFGPYSSAASVRETLRQLQRIFPLRTCSDSVLRNRMRPCLYYQMKQCAAPCVDYIDKAAYAEIVAQVTLALEGRNSDLAHRLKARIQACADRLEFEEAAKLRDRLQALELTLQRQRTVAVPGAEDRDVFGLYSEGRFAEIQAVFYRGGRMTGGRSFSFRAGDVPLDELFESFLLQYYAEAPVVPREVLVPVPLEDAETLAELLGELRGTKVLVHQPLRGEKLALVSLAQRNAKKNFAEKRLSERAQADLVEQVQAALGLPGPPKRIECFDIATTQGEQPVASMVVFESANPAKDRYRHYAIKHVEGQDDFASMREVLLRRYRRAIEEGDLPDLVLVDGGKGQLGVARTVLKDLGIEDLPVASIAKSRVTGAQRRSPERFFVPGRKNAIVLPQHSPVVRYLARIRDEAHRFANSYHAKRRGKATLRSALAEVLGIGPKRARLLLNKFGSLAKIKATSVDEIAALPSFSEGLARAVLAQLNEESRDPAGGREGQKT